MLIDSDKLKTQNNSTEMITWIKVCEGISCEQYKIIVYLFKLINESNLDEIK